MLPCVRHFSRNFIYINSLQNYEEDTSIIMSILEDRKLKHGKIK